MDTNKPAPVDEVLAACIETIGEVLGALEARRRPTAAQVEWLGHAHWLLGRLRKRLGGGGGPAAP